MIDWASDTFKALIAAVSLWIAAYIRKQAMPLFKACKKITVVVDRVDKLELKVSVIESRQFALIKTDPNPIYVIDTKGNLIYANMAWIAMTGFSDLDHAMGKGFMQAIPEEDFLMIDRLAERNVEHSSSFEGIINFQNIKTGERIKTMCRSEPMCDMNDNLIGTIGKLFILNNKT